MDAATVTPTATIHSAAKRGSYEEFQNFIAADATAALAPNADNRTALSLAAAAGHVKIVSALLNAGAVVAPEANDWTAVHHAAFKGHSEVLSAISAKLGAAALSPSTSMPPLLLAALKGDVACLTLLLDAAPASVNEALDAHGRTALMCAASGGSAAAVELLAARGAQLDVQSADGKTALMWAVQAHQADTLAALARLGADAEVAAPCPDVVVPGQDRSKGETLSDMANYRHSKDPTLRHMSLFVDEWKTARASGAPVPEMREVPWVKHAHAFKAKEAADAAAAAAKAAMDADEPLIAEVADDAGAAAPDEADIFGDADVEEAPVPVGGAAAEGAEEAEAALKAEAESAQKAVAADADLDELD